MPKQGEKKAKSNRKAPAVRDVTINLHKRLHGQYDYSPHVDEILMINLGDAWNRFRDKKFAPSLPPLQFPSFPRPFLIYCYYYKTLLCFVSCGVLQRPLAFFLLLGLWHLLPFPYFVYYLIN